MADIRTPAPGASLVPQGRIAPARSETVRAAQRAFFEAALNGTTAQSRPAPQARSAQPVAVNVDGAPNRNLRPGSLLDIKV
ncbi:MAG: hypothetical protein INR64_20560 [Caulobacteraceae bacterium]|nr:hypothetical protein [Caulobacter sp.]